MQVACRVYCSVQQSVTVVNIYIGLTICQFLPSHLIMWYDKIIRSGLQTRLYKCYGYPSLFIVMINSVTYMCVVWENTSSTSFGRFLTSIRLFIVGSFLGFLLKTPLIVSSCGRFQCCPVGGLRSVDGFGLLFTEFTPVLCLKVCLLSVA